MKKIVLRDIKEKNKRFVLQTIIDNKGISRIELATITKLSPSTISGIVAELLEDTLLVEKGELVSTGGRKRTELSLNHNYTSLIIVEVKRTSAKLYIFDMCLQQLHAQSISNDYISGDELFSLIKKTIDNFYLNNTKQEGKLSGIGLLFQEDMTENEFTVMYSTSISSDTISLKDALVSEFHIPVIEEYSQSYSITYFMQGNNAFAKGNTAFINIGQKVLASILIDGVPLELNNGIKVVNITPLLSDENSFSKNIENQEIHSQKKSFLFSSKMMLIAESLVNALKPMCIFFHIDTIFLDGSIVKNKGFTEMTQKILYKQLKPLHSPKVVAAEINYNGMADSFACAIRQRILFDE